MGTTIYNPRQDSTRTVEARRRAIQLRQARAFKTLGVTL